MSQKRIFDYEALVQKHLLKVVEEVLQEFSKGESFGKHHFYLTFLTSFPGVIVPDHLKEDYPDEITIILQHEFWDLEVTEKGFSVTLSFHDTQERLVVPFASIISFEDPSVDFALEFSPDSSFSPPEPPLPSKKERLLGGDSESSKVVSLDAFRKK